MLGPAPVRGARCLLVWMLSVTTPYFFSFPSQTVVSVHRVCVCVCVHIVCTGAPLSIVVRNHGFTNTGRCPASRHNVLQVDNSVTVTLVNILEVIKLSSASELMGWVHCEHRYTCINVIFRWTGFSVAVNQVNLKQHTRTVLTAFFLVFLFHLFLFRASCQDKRLRQVANVTTCIF